jgi:integrase
MRMSEVLNLRWSQLDLEAGAVRLEAEDTKTDEPRVVQLTPRVLEMLGSLRRLPGSRRSFITHARRSGVPESVVARFSGHRTAAVFKRYDIVGGAGPQGRGRGAEPGPRARNGHT